MDITVRYVVNTKPTKIFSGKGHANHICRECASLPAEQKAEMETITKILNLPGYITITQKTWLKNRTEDHRPKVRLLAKQAYEMRFHVEFEYDQEEIAIMDQEYREDCDCERHLTQEEFSQMNPKRKLLDFEIFRQANSGDSAALDAVVQYHRKDFDGYLGKSPDEIDIKLNNELICAFRKAIQKYKIKPGDTNYSYTELLDIAYDILESEDTDSDKF